MPDLSATLLPWDRPIGRDVLDRVLVALATLHGATDIAGGRGSHVALLGSAGYGSDSPEITWSGLGYS